MVSKLNRAQGALLGQLIGDSLGSFKLLKKFVKAIQMMCVI